MDTPQPTEEQPEGLKAGKLREPYPTSDRFYSHYWGPIAVLAVVTGLGWFLSHLPAPYTSQNFANIAMIYLLATVLSAVSWGLAQSLATAIGGFLLYHTLFNTTQNGINAPHEFISLLVFVSASFVAVLVGSRSRQKLEKERLQNALQKEQRQKEHEELRSALLASVTHDLKTPLASVIGSLSSVRHVASLNDAAREQLIKDPLIYVLLVAGAAALAMQRYPSTIFIFIVLMINAIIGTIQEYSATRAAAALKAMATPMARVRRDGKDQEIDAEELVPGDIVLLESGNKVPADCRLMECGKLKADESLLTGESHAVEKQAETTVEEGAGVNEQENMVFAGSVITHGRAKAIVAATGMDTQVGHIARHISEESATESPLIIRMKKFTAKIAIVIALAVAAISAVMYFRGDPPQEIFLMAIGLAVSAIPAGLPVALTVALAIGMRRMAKRNVIVRRLVAVEALGSCTMIASDKTGTLTRNEMTAERIVLPFGKVFEITTGDSLVEGNVKEASA